jgi:type II secretory pathway component GspD/PulD (secretin)/tetratricopeptide (TPR) repeat protein
LALLTCGAAWSSADDRQAPAATEPMRIWSVPAEPLEAGRAASGRATSGRATSSGAVVDNDIAFMAAPARDWAAFAPTDEPSVAPAPLAVIGDSSAGGAVLPPELPTDVPTAADAPTEDDTDDDADATAAADWRAALLAEENAAADIANAAETALPATLDAADAQVSALLENLLSVPPAEGEGAVAEVALANEETAIERLTNQERIRRQALAVEAEHYTEQGRRLFVAGQYEAALEFFDRALVAAPDAKDALDYRSRARQLAGRPDGDENAAAVRDIVRLSEARLKERELRLNNGLERASEAYLRTLSPDAARREMPRGEQIELSLLDLDAAEQSLQAVRLLLKGSGLPPAMERTLELRAKALNVQIGNERQKLTAERALRDRDLAQKAVQNDRVKVNAENAREVNAILTAADYHLGRKEYDAAMELIEKALALDPRHKGAAALRERARTLSYYEKNAEIAQDNKDSISNWSLDVQDAYIMDSRKLVTYPQDWDRIRERAKRVRRVSTVSDDEQKTLNRLVAVVGDFDYFEQPLLMAMKDFEQRAQVTISLASGIDGEDTIKTARLAGVSMKAAFDQILEDLGLVYKYEDEALVVSRKGAEIGASVMRIYPVADIVTRTTPFSVAKRMIPAIAENREDSSGSSDENYKSFVGGFVNNDDDDDDDDEKKKEWNGEDFNLVEQIKASIGGIEAWNSPNGIMRWEDNLVVYNVPEIQAAVEKFLDEWRAATRQQVFVEGKFLDINDSFSEKFGIDWNQTNGGGSGSNYKTNIQFGSGGSGTVNAVLQNAGDITNNAIGFLSNIGLNSLRLNLTLNAMQKMQKGSVLHNPKLLVTNGQVAYCQIVRERRYMKSWDVNDYAITPVIDSVMSGVTWEVRPVISFDRKYITVRVRPEMAEEVTASDINSLGLTDSGVRNRLTKYVSGGDSKATEPDGINTFRTIVTRTTQNGASGASTTGDTSYLVTVSHPTVKIAEFWTNAVVPDGGTVLVGGQLMDKTGDGVTGVPVLSNVPVIGRLARTDSKNKDSTNRVIMLSAKIVDLED